MATDVLMPQLGESIAEGTIVRWNKKVGESVDRDEPLFEVSTDKVDAEIPSPAAGVVTEIHASEGDTVPVDSVVARIGQAAEAAPTPSPSSSATPSVRPPTGETGVRPAEKAPTRPPAGLSPVVRKLAREHDLDLSTVQGTGAGGRITRADVLKAVETRVSQGRVEPMGVMRRRIAEHMVESRRTSAHVHTVFDVDFSHVAGLRDAHKADYERAGARLTYLVFVAKAVIDALSEVPIVNSSLQGDNIVYKDDVNLGVAVALDVGLIVPVVRRAQDLTPQALALAIADLADRARSKRLNPDEVADGTFTITNPGVFGSILGTPIINQPQSAILCMGAVEPRPAVAEGQLVVQTRAYLTLGFDHRVLDGAVADRFMGIVKDKLEQFDGGLL